MTRQWGEAAVIVKVGNDVSGPKQWSWAQRGAAVGVVACLLVLLLALRSAEFPSVRVA